MAKMNRMEMQSKFAARLRALEPWLRFTYTGDDGAVTYHACRFCHRNAMSDKVALWKYGVRHYICDSCKKDREGAA